MSTAFDQVVEVDYYVPGCKPTPQITKTAIAALLDGKLPPKGSVLAAFLGGMSKVRACVQRKDTAKAVFAYLFDHVS